MNPRSLLTDDHASLDKLLREIEAALRVKDVKVVASKLDLFWARLAVHIRSEHLHLFPVLLRAFKSDEKNSLAGTSLTETESTVSALRSDHDFFMRQLASAVALLRDQSRQPPTELMTQVQKMMQTVESRLKLHNDVEEALIYPLAMKLLSEQERGELVRQIRAELLNRPQRFTADEWAIQPV